MASETQMQPRPFPPVDAWPPDDTEENILGTDLHQMTIMNLRWGLNEVARLCRTPQGPMPWQALSQITVFGCLRPDGTDYRTMPDVFVYLRPIDQNRGSLAIEIDGPPALIIEVLSESTYRTDLDLERGKGYSYARAGVREYLAIDPTGAFLPERARAWRLADGAYRPWPSDVQGRWMSDEIAAAVGLEGPLATIYTHEGERQLHEGEFSEERTRMREELAQLRRLVDEFRGKE